MRYLCFIRSNDATSSDLQDWFASIDGGGDDTWFRCHLFNYFWRTFPDRSPYSSSLQGDLDDFIDAEKPSVPENCPMEVTNCGQ